MVKIILISMIKNEERIIERCIMNALPILDAVCVSDTGSTDNTINKVNTVFSKINIPGKIYNDEWKNFGHNRSQAFLNTVDYCKELGWDLNQTYGLLLDGDMELVVKKFDKNSLNQNGYRMLQSSGHIEYYNIRFVKLGFPWKCTGVTHEYWDGDQGGQLNKDSIYINDVGDGGCKSDKFQRDIRLLENGIKEEPNNVRYYFYLAQSYKDIGQFKKAIGMYKQRIKMGGWVEEVWYSYYMISKCWLLLNDEEKFEQWGLKAYKYRNTRAEPIYALTEHFRNKSQHYKAYYYYLIGKKTIRPEDDMLFVEKAVYEHLFDWEYSILQYYIFPNERINGMKLCVNYLNKYYHNEDGVFSNVDHYITRLLNDGTYTKIDVKDDGDFIPTSTSLLKLEDNKILANVRYVNYRIQPDGSYLMSKNGILDGNEKVRTRNAFLYYNKKMEPISELIFMDEKIYDVPSKDVHILGLEDVRLYKNDKKINYTATSLQYSHNHAIRTIKGEVDLQNRKFINNISMKPPTDTYCEKNWINMEDKFIYKWHPLQIGFLIDGQLEILNTIDTPRFFKHYRGSSNAFEYNNEFWFVTHGIKTCTPRKYFHQIVILDKETYQVKRYTVPFYFDKYAIEYCLGLVIINETVCMTASRNDKDPIICKITLENLEKYFM
jgi:hypothetical protein